MPSLPPPVTAELFLSGDWVDKTGDLRTTAPLIIKRGASSESSAPEPMEASCTFNNRSGEYSPRDPNSPLFGDLGRNTPIRFGVEGGGAWLRVTGAAASDSALVAPYNALMDVNDNIDLRFELAADPWWDNGIFATAIAERWDDTGDQRSWKLGRHEDGWLSFSWSEAGTLASVKTAISTEKMHLYDGQRICLRVTLDTSTSGGGAHEVRFYYSQTMNGGWHQLGEAVDTGGGVTALFNGTSGVWLGAYEDNDLPGSGGAFWDGDFYGFQLRDGINGPLKIDLNITDHAEPTDTSFVSQGITWSLQLDATFSNTHRRMYGEVPAWPIGRDRTGNDQYSNIEPAGIMRRLDAGKKLVDSALRSYLLDSNAIDCWPMTDGSSSTTAESITGGRPMLVLDLDPDGKSPFWAEGNVADWVEPVMLMKDDSLAKFTGFVVPTPESATDGFSFDFVKSDRGGITTLEIWDSGTATTTDSRIEYEILLRSGPNDALITRVARNADSSSTALLGQPTNLNIYDNLPHHIRFRVVQQVSSIDWFLYIDGVEVDNGSDSLKPVVIARASLSGPGFLVDINEDSVFGYLTYWPDVAPDASEVYQALLGFPGENSIERFKRICDLRSIANGATGLESGEQLLGFQERDKLLDLLNTSATPNYGYVLESRDTSRLIYRSGTTLYSQDALLTLDFSNGVISDPFRPTDDDKLTKNDILVNRNGGGFGTAVLEEGRMSVQDPQDGGVGRYDVSEDRSLFQASQASDQAGWELQLGTYDGIRYTRLVLNLANERVYAMINQIMKVDVGDKIQLINLPSTHGPDPVDLLVLGYEDEVGPEDWTITFSCRPGRPWNVATSDGQGLPMDDVFSELSHVDVDDSACGLLDAIDEDDAIIRVVTDAASEEWTEDQNEYPFDWDIEGERVKVLSYGRMMNADPYMLNQETDYFVNAGSTEAFDPDTSNVEYGGRGSIRVTPNGITASAGVFTNASPIGTVEPGKTYTATAWVMSTFTQVLRPAYVALYWYDSSSVFISATFSTPGIFLQANQWTQLSVSAVAPVNASRVQVEGRLDGTPAVTDLAYWWGLKGIREELGDVQDSFDRADNAATPGSADTGQAWVETLNQWGILSNRLYAINSANSQVTIAGNADIRELSITPAVWSGTDETYLMIRFTDTNNRIRIGCNHGSVIQLQVITGGAVVRTVLGAIVPVQGDRLTVVARGAIISAYVNGQLALMVSETAHLTASIVGIQTASNVPRFDNFICRWSQQVSVIRSYNGIEKSHPADAQVDLFTEPIVAL